MANQFLGLSLFIMLLSFFIVMNSVSDFEETKVNPVIDSIEMAFGGKPAAQTTARPVSIPKQAPENNEGETLEQLEALFAAHIKDYEVNKNRLGTMMQIEMSVAEFEEILRGIELAQAGEVSADNLKFVPSLVSLIDTSQTQKPYRMDMFVQAPDNPAALQNNEPQAMAGLLARAGRYGQALELAGLERKLMSSGVMDGEEGRLTLIFRRYKKMDLALNDIQSLTQQEEGVDEQ